MLRVRRSLVSAKNESATLSAQYKSKVGALHLIHKRKVIALIKHYQVQCSTLSPQISRHSAAV